MKLKTLIYLSLTTFITSLALAAHAQTFSVIHAFNGVSGENPQAGVTLRGGVLYGTTDCVQNCGGAGVVYKMSPMGSNWFYTPISLLTAGGYGLEARVLFGPDNQLYGTTAFSAQGYGIVFSLAPMPTICRTANCFWAEKVLYQFGGVPDGVNPGYGDLVWDSMGNIYGTTRSGGTSNHGTAYKMTKSGNNWSESIIYSFTGLDGDSPTSGVTLDSKGNLFGTAEYGGANGFGSVFKLTPSGNGWIETNIYDFQGDADGEYPIAGLMMDGAGNIYGATSDGGSGGGGTVFELSPADNGWTFTLLYSFSGQQGDSCGPRATLAMDNSGNLYGTTFCDGTNSLGNVFELANTANGWEYNSLHDFTHGTDGAGPFSNVTIDAEGTLYGTALFGGNNSCLPPYGCGTVWMIKP